MRRSVWVALALMALGLWASLFPQVTYPSSSSGDPDGDVLITWPGWSVQQELGSVTGTVGTFRIWVSADPTAFKDVTLNASLIDASTREVLRQTLVTVSRRYIPAAHTVTFPGYAIPPGQRLMLQFGVPEAQERHVIYRLANPDPTHQSIMLNGVPEAGDGPLAFAQLRTGSGLRAALDGEVSSRLRLVLGIGAGALALLAHPRVAGPLGQATHGARRRSGRLVNRVWRVNTSDADRTTREPPSRIQRLLEAPWYPWPAAAVPVLHYLASNPLHFAVSEAIVPLAVALAAVTALVVALRVRLTDWHRSAALCMAVIVVFFGYGHADGVVDGRLDDRLMFGLAVVLVASIAMLLVRSGAMAARSAPFLNLTSAVLLVFTLTSVVAEVAEAPSQQTSSPPASMEDLAAHLLPAGIPAVSGPRPDIYYIILDSYSRHDELLDLYGFDNSDFLRELERRGFYVAAEANSNYDFTVHSISSSLNMEYLNGLGPRVPVTHDDLIGTAHNHALAAILKSIGYEYIHLESGFVSTEASPLADQVITFTPSGVLVRAGNESQSHSYEDSQTQLISSRFIRGFAQTTALASIVGLDIFLDDSEPYEWWSPHRTLAMFDFLADPVESERPKLVFAHIVKPHAPYTFDQYGNFLGEGRPLDDAHDPSVPNAYIGQIKFVNKRVLKVVDEILVHSKSRPSIIVIAGDHGQEVDGAKRHAILSAFHLPSGGNIGLYPSISLVNHFRYILDFYFDLDLGLLPDRTLSNHSDRVDFRR